MQEFNYRDKSYDFMENRGNIVDRDITEMSI